MKIRCINCGFSKTRCFPSASAQGLSLSNGMCWDCPSALLRALSLSNGWRPTLIGALASSSIAALITHFIEALLASHNLGGGWWK